MDELDEFFARKKQELSGELPEVRKTEKLPDHVEEFFEKKKQEQFNNQ